MSHDAKIILITIVVLLAFALLLAVCGVRGMRRAVEVARLQTQARTFVNNNLQPGREYEAEVYFYDEEGARQYKRLCDYSVSDRALSLFYSTGYITIIPERMIRKVFIRPARDEEEIEFDVEFEEEDENNA